MVDHHTASTQFMRHWQREADAGRMVPADWGRIVPPLLASTLEVFHQEMHDVWLKPNFFPLSPPWIAEKGTMPGSQAFLPNNHQKQCPFHLHRHDL